MRYLTALAFCVLAFAGGWAIHTQAKTDAELLRKSQIEACLRDNEFRREDNRRGNVLRALINQNSILNKDTDLPPIKIRDIPLTDCRKAYPYP